MHHLARPLQKTPAGDVDVPAVHTESRITVGPGETVSRDASTLLACESWVNSAPALSSVGLLVARLARRYVSWCERPLRRNLVELRLEHLQSWSEPCPWQHAELKICSLPECGNEWLFRKVFNRVAQQTDDVRPARHVDILAFMAAPNHDARGMFLARWNDEYVGTCVGRVRSNHRGAIYSVTVHPEYRGRGIARALLRTTLTYLRQQGVREVTLHTHTTNAVALGLYQAEGFRIISAHPQADGT